MTPGIRIRDDHSPAHNVVDYRQNLNVQLVNRQMALAADSVGCLRLLRYGRLEGGVRSLNQAVGG